MRIEHLALYVRDLEGMRAFFETYFEASCGAKYHNPKTGFSSYFLTFSDGARLEIMHRPDLRDEGKAPLALGYIHLAFSLGSKEKVDSLTKALTDAGCPLHSGPRITGDGYYESCILDPEGNLIELTL